MSGTEHLAILHGLFGDSGEPLAWWQMCARAMVVFVYGIALVRLAGTRVFGKGAALDIILSVIIGSNLSRALTGNAPLWEVLITTTFLVGLHWLVAEIAFRNRTFATWVKGQPKELIRDGKRVERTISREEIGERDLDAALRSASIEDVSEVGRAVLERDGSITVRARDGEEGGRA